MTAHRGIRFREDVGFEMRCCECSARRGQSFWPLTLEFWDPDRGMGRCRACWASRGRTNRRRSAPLAVQIARGEAIREEKRIAARRAYNRTWMRRSRAAARELRVEDSSTWGYTSEVEMSDSAANLQTTPAISSSLTAGVVSSGR